MRRRKHQGSPRFGANLTSRDTVSLTTSSRFFVYYLHFSRTCKRTPDVFSEAMCFFIFSYERDETTVKHVPFVAIYALFPIFINRLVHAMRKHGLIQT